MGGRGSSSRGANKGQTGGGGSAKGSGTRYFEANFTTSDFNQVSPNRWESKRQTTTAAALVGNPHNRRLIGENGAQFEIIKNGDKYVSYIRGLNRRTRIKSSNSLKSAISSINKYTRDYIVW